MRSFLSLLFPFLSRADPQASFKKCRDSKVQEWTTRLSALAAHFCEAADTIYQKVLLEQFHDYEERYGPGLTASLNDVKKAALIGTIKRFMLYTFFRYVEKESPESVYLLTMTLQEEMEKCRDGQIGTTARGTIPSFMDYVNYQNPHFEDPTMAPVFKFGNDIGEIVENGDRPFSFMAAQQGMMIAEITKTLLRLPTREGEATEHVVFGNTAGVGASTATSGSRGSGVAGATVVFGNTSDISASTATNGSRGPEVAVPPTSGSRGLEVAGATWGWWFAWGVFSGMMVLIVLKGGNLSLGAQIFVLLGAGVLSGTTALFCFLRKRLPR